MCRGSTKVWFRDLKVVVATWTYSSTFAVFDDAVSHLRSAAHLHCHLYKHTFNRTGFEWSCSERRFGSLFRDTSIGLFLVQKAHSNPGIAMQAIVHPPRPLLNGSPVDTSTLLDWEPYWRDLSLSRLKPGSWLKIILHVYEYLNQKKRNQHDYVQ